jgi:glyoxylase-like metal-dependent hydrolase (beta-lactamase superfamily II)
MITIVNVGYDSTNYYVLGPPNAYLLIDVGMPGTFPKLSANLRRMKIPISAIRYLLATHYHPDHAGIAQELKAHGIQLLVLESQVAAIPRMQGFMNASMPYQAITLTNTIPISTRQSRAWLKQIGIAGSIISTPGHSEDSVSLVLDDGRAFTGDLPPPELADPLTQPSIRQSWEALRALRATTIYPGHGPVRPIPPP